MSVWSPTGSPTTPNFTINVWNCRSERNSRVSHTVPFRRVPQVRADPYIRILSSRAQRPQGAESKDLYTHNELPLWSSAFRWHLRCGHDPPRTNRNALCQHPDLHEDLWPPFIGLQEKRFRMR